MASDRALARSGRFAAALLLAALALPSTALAQQPSAADKETARSLMDKGDERMDAKDYAAAVEAFVAADALMHLPMTGVAVARAQAAAGLLLEARDKAIQVTLLPAQPSEAPPYVRARAAAAALADTLAARIPSIRVVLEASPPDLVVTIDGVALPAATALEPRKVNPGRHEVTVTAPHFLPARVEVTVVEGAARSVPVALQAAPLEMSVPPPPPPSPLPPREAPAPPPSRGVSPLAVVGFTVGGASLLAGAITGGLSLSKTKALKGVCTPSGDCGTTHDHDLALANTLADVSDVTIAAGVAGVVAGVIGVVLSRAPASQPAAASRVEPMLGPGRVGLRGVF
jgi:PEGA domain